MNKNHKQQFQNIYDVICNTSFSSEARKELNTFLKGKQVEWDGDNNIITIGKHFKFKLITK